MEIDVNGAARRIEAGLTVRGLVALLGLEDRLIAVERNLEIVPLSAWDDALVAGDRIEIVNIVGGG